MSPMSHLNNRQLEPEDLLPRRKKLWLRGLSERMVQALSRLSLEWATPAELHVSIPSLHALVLRGLAERRGISNGSGGGQTHLARMDNQYRLSKKGRKKKEEG